MKILIVGTWRWFPFEEAFSQGLRENGVQVTKIATPDYLSGFFSRAIESIPVPTPSLIRLNQVVVSKAIRQQPDAVLFWRPTHIFPSTLRTLSESGIKSVSYNNDDPFGPKKHRIAPWHHRWLWFWYLRCLPLFDKNFFFREVNCREAEDFGVKHAEVLLPCFTPSRDHPIELSESERVHFDTDVVFVGHYEPDGREIYVRSLVEAGIKTKIYGGKYWNRSVLGDSYDKLPPITSADGDDYPKALSGAKVCLSFVSKLNRDTYTYRCFEIPACGKAMLAERTDDLTRFFREDEEACFFSSEEELKSKAQWLIKDPDARDRIAQAGLKRVWQDGHDVASRAKEFLNSISS